ncbi:MAG: 4-(cytidine 5'-diphospho)-2-C-methyl-D-erythritol kinase [Candidatus Nanopelagicales bacterium]|jgi:4-diphosphocytidyl-2-C-methyl-D-erythritol kinase
MLNVHSVVRSVTVRVPAKVNLQLSVGPLRVDGYHEIVSVFHAVNIYDEIVAADGVPGSGITLTMEGASSEHLSNSRDNLVWRAATALAQYADVALDVELAVKKKIPLSGGMAGGSADAAAALVACDALWRIGLGREELDVLAARLGADVTFALHGGTAIGTGRGERLTPALISGQYHWVFAVSDEGLSTPAVYAECDRLREGRPVSTPSVAENLMAALRRGDPVAVGNAMRNDLQAAAISLRPQLELVLETGLSFGALGAIVSGSGPTCAFLARDEEQALDIAAALSGSGMCSSVMHASGPAHGARVVDSGTSGSILNPR